MRIDLRGIRGIEDLSRLPILDKEMIFRLPSLEKQLHDEVSRARLVRVGTSGSTGLPINIYMTWGEALFRRVQLLAEWRRVAQLPLILRVADVGSWVRGNAECESTRRGPVRITRISMGLPIDRQVELLKAFHPDVISGYPTVLTQMADWLRKKDDAVHVKLVATRGEVLHDAMRYTIGRAFTGRLLDFYNCEEVGNVASECPDHPHLFHINTDACIVEVVDEDGAALSPGNEGRILLTNLYNHTMSIIRYDIRDRGFLVAASLNGRCSCGSRRPLMTMSGGRDDDFAILPTGKRISPRLIVTAVNRSFDDLSEEGGFDRFMRRFQVIQDAEDHFTIRVIPEPDCTTDLESVIGAGLTKIDARFSCTVVRVDELPHDPSGKFKKLLRTFDP